MSRLTARKRRVEAAGARLEKRGCRACRDARWRVRFENPEAGEPEPVEHCARCGRALPCIVVHYVDEVPCLPERA